MSTHRGHVTSGCVASLSNGLILASLNNYLGWGTGEGRGGGWWWWWCAQGSGRWGPDGGGGGGGGGDIHPQLYGVLLAEAGLFFSRRLFTCLMRIGWD